ncbi:hypothetical protein [Luteimicrobium album]|uniref:hypothetical protein n=1 Tax=Luteimicrobium album TaxID=1054550 RepID=UPI0024E08445|nr:hypothetical protein [Luteimicrobium album]
MSLAVSPMFVPRYLAYTAPAVALLLGAFLASIGLRWAVATGAVLTVLGAWAVAQAWSVGAKDNSDWSAAAEVVSTHGATCDAVVFVPDDGSARSPRRARDAYPSDFVGLADVGFAVRGSEHGQLFDAGRPTSPSDVSRGACTVGLVSLRETTLDAAVTGLATEGWSSVDVIWSGPSTVVLRLSASDWAPVRACSSAYS